MTPATTPANFFDYRHLLLGYPPSTVDRLAAIGDPSGPVAERLRKHDERVARYGRYFAEYDARQAAEAAQTPSSLAVA